MVNYEKALRSLWRDILTVEVFTPYEKANGATGMEPVAVIIDEPCKLSFSSVSVTEQGEDVARIAQAAKVFCGVALDIPAGSKITVEHGSRKYVYKQSGAPSRYTAHQEIALVPFEGLA